MTEDHVLTRLESIQAQLNDGAERFGELSTDMRLVKSTVADLEYLAVHKDAIIRMVDTFKSVKLMGSFLASLIAFLGGMVVLFPGAWDSFKNLFRGN